MSIAIVSLLVALPLGDVDFVRGDANADGTVSISDPHFLLSHVFRGLAPPECSDAADADDNGSMDLSDVVYTLAHLFLGRPAPPAPFPAVGADPTADGLDCAGNGSGAPIADPVAELKILSVEANGGDDPLARITIAVSSSNPIAGYSGSIRLPPGLASGVSPDSARDLSGTLEEGFIAARLDGDAVRFGFLSSFIEPGFIPPGNSTPVLAMSLCLVEGLAAGDYPLLLELGELTDFDAGQAIVPSLVSSILHVPQAVTAAVSCVPTPPPPRVPVNAVFKLQDVVGAPGSDVTVPFIIRADAPIQAYTVSVDFDETLLEVTSIEQVWQKPLPADPRYSAAFYRLNNSDDHPGSAGVDEGFIIAGAAFDYEEPVAMPANTDNVALNFHFRVKAATPDVSSEVRFLDGGQQGGQPVRNLLYSDGSTVSPEAAISFLFIDCLFQILPDGAVFRRGDSNGDGRVDVSDPIRTLGRLFLGDGPLLCEDAADANDDGQIDISDPVVTLEFLFLGRSELPPPGSTPAEDSTPDSLRCFALR